MWPLSWYQFCVSLPLEVRTVGVLFLPVLTLLSVLHCLPPAGHVEPVFSDSVFSAAVCRNYTTQRRKCCLPPVPPLSPATLDMTFCLWKPLPHLPSSSPPSWSHVYHISALRETCPESHADREEEGRMNGGRSKWSSVFVIDFHPILPALQPPVNTPLPYHFPLHPVTVTTSQPPRSALRCVPLTDSCFTFPLILAQPRSVDTSRRRSDISTFIQDNMDIMLLTETWLRPAGDEARIADLAPPGYSVLSFPRSAGESGAKGGKPTWLRHKGLS